MMKCKWEWFKKFKKIWVFVEPELKYEIKNSLWISENDRFPKDFEAFFFMEHNIESTSQNIGPMEYAIQTSVSMTKCMLKV